jgi:protein-S-isoprenylcysteine O-methyltransferase Ste14
MWTLIIFAILSLVIISFSWRALLKLNSHGFYRFFCWESIAWLASANHPFWFKDPFHYKQIISWSLLIIGAYLVIAGVLMLKKHGKADKAKREKELYQFEATSKLVTTGIFKYIRHPLYSSLLFLTWGIFFKNATLSLSIVSLISTFFLFITAWHDEKECIQFFGEEYKAYMKKTKRFVPFIF